MVKKVKKEVKEEQKEPKVEQKLCDVCGEDAVARESDGHFYCYTHHMLWTKCWTHERIVDAWKQTVK